MPQPTVCPQANYTLTDETEIVKEKGGPVLKNSSLTPPYDKGKIITDQVKSIIG